MTNRFPYVHPSAWLVTDIRNKDGVSVHLTERHIQAFDTDLKSIKSRGLSVEDIGQEDFPLTPIRDCIRDWHHQVQEGRGLLVLQGIPAD